MMFSNLFWYGFFVGLAFAAVVLIVFTCVLSGVGK